MIFVILVILIFILTLPKIHRLGTFTFCKSKVCLVGKTAIVTGANTGIGYETAIEFAKRGAKVILACRNESKAQEAVDTIKKETHNPNVYYKIVNFASFASVRAFAKDIIATEDRLDILVNNAGTAVLGPNLSEDGISFMFQINYLSHFLLTNLLLDLLMKNPSRVVNVSSFLARNATPIDFDNLTLFTGDRNEYPRSKLCQILFTTELAKRCAGTNVTTFSLHPGFVRTNIFDDFSPVIRQLIHLLGNMYGKSPEEGAQTQIYCSIALGLEQYSGKHFHDCRIISTYRTARDPEAAKLLWEATEKLLSLK